MDGRRASRRAMAPAALSVLLLMGAAAASGQSVTAPESPGALSSLPVPGGIAAMARIAGVDEATPRGVALLQLIRVIHESPAGNDRAREARVESLRAYLADLSDFIRLRAVLPGGQLSAGLARSPEARRAIEDVAKAVGGYADDVQGVSRFVFRDDDRSRRRRQHLEAAGLDVAALEREFNSGGTVALTVASDEVPLPFDVKVWERLVPGGDAAPLSLLTALLEDRRASLLYYGLMGLDVPTRAYIGANPSRLGKLLEGDRPAVLATLGRSIHIHNGTIDVPGGPGATEAWEGLLQKRAGDPEGFLLELLDRDGGRAALLYDLIAHLDPPRQAFALGLPASDHGSPAERLRALYAACGASLDRWDPEIRPFRRVTYDPVHLLAEVQVLPSGELPQPAGRRFWSVVMASTEVPDEPDRLLKANEPDSHADAAWLVGQICVANPARRQQLLRLWLFGQRAFAGVDPAALPRVLVALRGFARFPMLLLTLERMGIRDPDVYAVAVRHAKRLSSISDPQLMSVALRQFQGALAILERVRFSRAVSPDVVARLIRTLTTLPVSESGEYLNAVGAWIDAQLLPALPPASVRGAEAAGTLAAEEARLLAAAAGASGASTLPEVEWEGLRYRVDVGEAEFTRLSRIRRKQGGYSLDAALELSRAVSRLGALSAPSGDVPALAAALTSSVTSLLEQAGSTARSDKAGADLRDLLDEARKALSKAEAPKGSVNLGRVYRPLQKACDLLFAGVLSSLAYAPHLGDPEGPELLAGDPADRHDFGLDERIPEIRLIKPWRVPERTIGVTGGWHATGSLLGLDVGLATLTLRRLAVDSLPPPPTGNDIDRASVAASVALSNPFAVSDSERDTLADEIRRGRARLQGLTAQPSALPDLMAAARLDEWRSAALPWAQVKEPGRVPEYFALADLARIGEAEGAPAPPLDSWGAAWLDTQGCVCLRYPVPGVRESLAGRMGTALVTEQFVDLQLRVAEALADRDLPARLARFVMALAAQDVVDTYRPAYIDDWSALTAAVRRLPDARMIDFISALTSGGPLVPGDGERSDDARR